MNDQDFLCLLNQKLAEIASAMMLYYDCCGMRGGACKGGDPNPCCSNDTVFGKGLCPFSQDNQCQFLCAGCKIWICKTAIESTDPKCVEGLKLLEQFGMLYGLVKRPYIGQPYRGADRKKG